MSEKTLFLAWQDKPRSHSWFAIGRLDADLSDSLYRFRYTQGAERAREGAAFEPLLDFPELHRDYRSPELFPLFQNRVMTRRRPDFVEYLRQLDLPEQANPIEILSVNGGHRATDSFEVFPELESDENGEFRCRFFLHGWRHANADAQRRIDALRPDEPLHMALEWKNPQQHPAIQLQTDDYSMIGWAPRYLAAGLAGVVAAGPEACQASVVRVNPVPAPSSQRLLVELRGRWPEGDSLAMEELKPLVE